MRTVYPYIRFCIILIFLSVHGNSFSFISYNVNINIRKGSKNMPPFPPTDRSPTSPIDRPQAPSTNRPQSPPTGRPPSPPTGRPPSPPTGRPPGGGGPVPMGPPPSNVPRRPGPPSPGVRFVNPGSMRNCIGRFTYVWLSNGLEFWFFPVQIWANTVVGFRWDRRFGWSYTGISLNRIDMFSCT